MGSVTPKCIYCGTVRESFTGDPCQCTAAKEIRAARETARQEDAARWAAAKESKATIAPPLPARDDGLAVLRRQAAKEQADAAKDAELDDRARAVRDRELSRREHRQDAADAPTQDTDTPAEGMTFADFGQTVTLLDIERLPSAFDRVDGATLLYEGLANTIYGEPSTGKSWIGLMVAIQQLRAGRRVLWWDNEDRATTLARRLQLLRATDLIGVDDLAWRTGDMHQSAIAMAEALTFLDGGNGPGLVVIDSATSFGCPKDGADVQPWIAAHIKPWLNAGHTTLLLDHVPKQRKDRPAGAVGSYEKLSDIRGAALYAHGTAWNGQDGGAVHLTIHKDAHGQLPAPKFATVATVTADWDGPTLAYTVGLPNAKEDGEDLQTELMDALEQAGSDGVRGSRAIRDLLKGKRAKDIDAARDELVAAGLVEKRPDGGNAQRYILVN